MSRPWAVRLRGTTESKVMLVDGEVVAALANWIEAEGLAIMVEVRHVEGTEPAQIKEGTEETP